MSHRSEDATSVDTSEGAGTGPLSGTDLEFRFEVGATVVYPVHGVAEVLGHETRVVSGVRLDYLVLLIEGEIRADDLTLRVRMDRLEEIGVRPAISLAEVVDVLSVLGVRDPRVPSNWARRLKSHQAKLRGGDVLECAEVVRNLALRQRQKPLASAERAMYRQARTRLVAELAVTWGISSFAASDRVDEALPS